MVGGDSLGRYKKIKCCETFPIFFPTNHRLMRSFLCVAKMVRAITRLRIIV